MPRHRLNINREWRFLRDDVPNGADPALDDSSWQRVNLPHTFDLPYFRTPEFYVGVGWYRKRLDCRGLRQGKLTLFSLAFDGVFQTADVFVNGERVGGHRGGYTGFEMPIVPPPSGEVLIAVRVSNEWDAQLQPRAGEHVFPGGIYRDVHLVVREPLHIAWNGIAVTTPCASRASAVINVKTRIPGWIFYRTRCSVEQTIVDPGGEILARFVDTTTIGPNESFTFDQTSPPIDRPALWHPDHPHLYALKTRLLGRDGELVEEVETRFGIRSFEWTPDRGFFLNGEHLYLRGANLHQDHAGWGIAITRAACERDVRLMKEAGFNFVRGAHYPHHPAFADACDRLGMLFWSENCFWGKGGFGPEGYWNASAYPVNETDFAPFEDSCRQQLAEMIEINRNHPSIVAWSMTNEAFFTYNLDRAKNLISELVTLSRKRDPTRPAAIGGAQRGDVDQLGDVAGYNGDGARLFLNPGVPNMVSEYGAISKPHDAFEPFWGELQPERYPWRSGQAIWAGADYGSIAGRQGLKGIVNHQRLPKRSWHWYRREHLGIEPPPAPIDGKPARLRLEADKTTIAGTDGTDDVQLTVTVLDATGRHVRACPPITLTIASGPGEFPTGRSITFAAGTDIAPADGQAAMAMRSYHGGRSIVRAASPGLESASIEITTEGEPAYVEGVTPPVTDRSYVPPPVSEAAQRAMANHVNVALNRPCRASREAERHPPRFANDGSGDTSWRAGAGDGNAPGEWWQVDLEGFYQISGSRLTFPSDGNWRFTIELSQDGAAWTRAVDRSETVSTSAVRNDIHPPGAIARYLRVAFAAPQAAALAEVEVFGVLSVR